MVYKNPDTGEYPGQVLLRSHEDSVLRQIREDEEAAKTFSAAHGDHLSRFKDNDAADQLTEYVNWIKSLDTLRHRWPRLVEARQRLIDDMQRHIIDQMLS